MATLSKGTTYTDGMTVTHGNLNALVDSATISGIVNADIDAGAAIAPTKLAQITTASKVSGAALTALANIPAGAGVIPSANLPGNSVTGYRCEMFCAYASTTTLTVGVGDLEINGSLVSKASATTLTLGTDADWAGGSSLRAVSTYAYVGVDASGNIKMHTTAPTHSDYAVSVTAGVKRYATWDGTVYRIIGWFRMNATGSGELSASTVSNLKDGDVYNSVEISTATNIDVNDTSYGTDMDVTTMYFYSVGRPVQITFTAQCDVADIGAAQFLVDVDGTDKTTAETQAYIYSTGGTKNSVIAVRWQEKLTQGVHTIKIQGKVGGGTLAITNWYFEINEA